ncbi:AAA family ATPase [Legionella septentrionalis]|uniref:AAA family ATPase n=1 Tax=Legionella septentrionalis TaxID=2498109 RepID=UPI000F8EEB4E|nr:AAA family ATPase [Legionella septentrionalis]RUR13096.1 hypothetical protein ELY10_10905 [Legionella septentrionalis]
MDNLLKRIDTIKNMAVYDNFQWSNSIRDNQNNIAEFRKINIFYGRNYSGKTTLSRILRALETGTISERFNSPEFQLSFGDGTIVKQNALTSHNQLIRVFNKDFVKDNLHFIIDDDQHINSFAILGENNTKLEKEIEFHEEELGSDEKVNGLIGKYIDLKNKSNAAKKAYNDASEDLESKLRDKANKPVNGIKHNKIFGSANYNVNSLKADISTVLGDYTSLNTEKSTKYLDLLKEEPKNEILEHPLFNLRYPTIISSAKELIEKQIQISAPIQELLNDAALTLWVRQGRNLHENKRNECGFCGNALSKDLWDKLDKHFNQESEELLQELNQLISLIDAEIDEASNLLKLNYSDFYSKFTTSLSDLEKNFSIHSNAYCAALKLIKIQLENRKNDIFTPLEFNEPVSVTTELEDIQDTYEELRVKSNQLTASLSQVQSDARKALRLNEVFNFITDIKYSEECKSLALLKDAMENADKSESIAKGEVEAKRKIINTLKSQLQDESKGAEQVNSYLNHFFGHQYLSLRAIEKKSQEETSGYQFEVTRNGDKAFHLSEGECSLIAFCYFMAKLKDVNTKGNKPIIWIDDPISSMDSNHIFFVYSLINAEIVSPEKYNDGHDIKERDRFKQLFISTHNLDFLKYLKRLPGANNDEKQKEHKKRYRYFIIERTDNSSTIRLMPNYLREYVTEFNYLFEQLYKCASIEKIDDSNYTIFYNFGNNARKFLEIYLYYKYPNQGMNENTLQYFFGEGKVPAVLTDRINNEYSHLAGIFERGSTPIEVPEMKTAASYILEKIKESDPDQYSALLQSINIIEESLQKSAVADKENK